MNTVTRAFRKLNRLAKFRRRLRQIDSLGITYAAPNYIYRGSFTDESIVIDVGCADDADFCVHMIRRFGARTFGVDPTRKHAAALAELERKMGDRFKHLPYAVASKPGISTFHQSDLNVSGSLLSNHTNILHDTTQSYEVEAVTLRGLLDKTGTNRCDFLKLDVEGAEYELLADASSTDLEAFGQVFVEFHHHAIRGYSIADTRSVVASVCARGFQQFSLDDQNYLFFR